jgi:hypothetical protein
MKHLEISVRVCQDAPQPESILYQRSIALPEGSQPEDWQPQSVDRIKQASDEVAALLAETGAKRAGGSSI